MSTSRSRPFSISGRVVRSVSDVFGAVCARSLRSSFSACAVRIFATISGLVFDGGGAGSAGWVLGIGFAWATILLLPLPESLVLVVFGERTTGIFLLVFAVPKDFTSFGFGMDAILPVALGAVILFARGRLEGFCVFEATFLSFAEPAEASFDFSLKPFSDTLGVFFFSEVATFVFAFADLVALEGFVLGLAFATAGFNLVPCVLGAMAFLLAAALFGGDIFFFEGFKRNS